MNEAVPATLPLVTASFSLGQLMVYQLFLESPILSDGHDGVPESLQ